MQYWPIVVLPQQIPHIVPHFVKNTNRRRPLFSHKAVNNAHSTVRHGYEKEQRTRWQRMITEPIVYLNWFFKTVLVVKKKSKQKEVLPREISSPCHQPACTLSLGCTISAMMVNLTSHHPLVLCCFVAQRQTSVLASTMTSRCLNRTRELISTDSIGYI